MIPEFRVLCTNAFGLGSKLADFQHALLQHSPDVAVVTETKFTEEKTVQSATSFPGYGAPFRRDRTAHGGGIAVWVKATLPALIIEELSDPQHEILWVSIQLTGGRKVVLGAVYRPGSCAPGDLSLINHLDDTLPGALQHGSHLILAGDFNVHNQAWLHSSKTTPAGEALEDVCAAHRLTQHVRSPTRGDNTLDLVMSTFISPVETQVRAPLGRSDHSVVLSDFVGVLPAHEPPVKRTVWRYDRADWNRFRAFLRNVSWPEIITEDPDASCERITATISSAITRFVPSKELVTKPTDPKWWTPECSAAMKEKDKRWRSWRKYPHDVILKQEFTHSVNVAVNTLSRSRAAKDASIRRSLSSGSMKDKEWWTKLKYAGGDGRNTDIPTIIDSEGRECATSSRKSEAFGGFFSKKCSVTGPDLTVHDLPDLGTVDAPALTTVHFRPDAVHRLLARLDASKATGPDGISARVLKECARELAKPLSQLFALCFRHGVQPRSWKIANVVPIHKRSSRSVQKNYRPVSLLCIMSKVMEAIVNRQIMNHLESHQLLTPHQFGFRRGLGTADALQALHNAWVRTVGNGGAARILAVDIAGAFDRVSHVGLLHKAQHLGINGTLHSWLSSYLDGRSLRCVVGGQTSSQYPISAGVPQGSILGPTLFLIYVNDAADVLVGDSKLEAYADDTTLYSLVSCDEGPRDATQSLQLSINQLHAWGCKWKVSFEPTKSQVMTATLRTTDLDLPQISFGGIHVPEATNISLLGVQFDSKLSFGSHLRAVATRARRRLGFLRRAAHFLTPAGRTTVYKAFVRPLMEYAPLVWMGAPPSHIQRLDRVQRRALQIIGPGAILPSLAVRRSVAALSCIYKLHYIAGPPQLRSVLPPPRDHPANPKTRSQRRSATGHAHQLQECLPPSAPFVLTRSFPHCSVGDWNSLPPSLLTQAPHRKGLQSFKTKVYRHLRSHNWYWATDTL